MKKVIPPAVSATSIHDWKQLFEAALFEDDPDMFPHRLQNARDAIVETIENSFDTAPPSDRLLLLAALNTISGLFEADLRRSRLQDAGLLCVGGNTYTVSVTGVSSPIHYSVTVVGCY